MIGFDIRGRDFIIPILLILLIGYGIGKGIEWVSDRVSIKIEAKK